MSFCSIFLYLPTFTITRRNKSRITPTMYGCFHFSYLRFIKTCSNWVQKLLKLFNCWEHCRNNFLLWLVTLTSTLIILAVDLSILWWARRLASITESVFPVFRDQRLNSFYELFVEFVIVSINNNVSLFILAFRIDRLKFSYVASVNKSESQLWV